MRVADLDEVCKEMEEVFSEIEVSDEFKKGFGYALKILKEQKGVKIPKAKPDEVRVRSTTLELRIDV